MKFTKIAAVVALVAAGSANAAVSTTLGNAEIFLNAYDDAKTLSYIYDTGVNVSSLINNTISYSLNLGADANWATFVSKVGGIANINWNVSAIQNQAGTATKFIYSTINQSQSVGALALNGAFNTRVNPEITALTNVAAGALLGSLTGPSSIEAAGTAGYIGDNFDNLNIVGVNQITNKLNVGNVSFVGVANSTTTSNIKPVKLFATPTAMASFSTASGSAVLSIGTPAVTPAVPEPTTSALALAALAGIGFVARRRAK